MALAGEKDFCVSAGRGRIAVFHDLPREKQEQIKLQQFGRRDDARFLQGDALVAHRMADLENVGGRIHGYWLLPVIEWRPAGVGLLNVEDALPRPACQVFAYDIYDPGRSACRRHQPYVAVHFSQSVKCAFSGRHDNPQILLVDREALRHYSTPESTSLL